MNMKANFTTPRAISMLMHFAARHEPYIDLPLAKWPDKDKETVQAFLDARLIQIRENATHETHYELADNGKRVMHSIKWALRSQLRKQQQERGKHRDF